jgi:hypothetical protein
MDDPRKPPHQGTTDSGATTVREFPQGLIWMFLACVFAAVAFYAWATDYITWSGERTVYTVACTEGAWVANRCTGTLVPAERYRFRALKARGEVLFWTAGVREPSSKYTGCTIASGRDWSCPANAEASRTITLVMKGGYPAPDPQGPTRAFHSVPKVRWLLLRAGLTLGSTANE